MLSNLDLHPRVLKGTPKYQGVNYPNLYNGTYKLPLGCNPGGFQVWNLSGGSIRLGFGYAILGIDNLLAPVYVYTSGNINFAGWYGMVMYSGCVNVTVADDDTIIPVWGAYSLNVTTWNMSSNITTWKLESHPLLDLWDFTANHLDFYPTTQRTNSLISADGVFTMKSPSVQVDGDVRVLGARTHLVLNDNNFSGAFLEQTRMSNWIITVTCCMTELLNGTRLMQVQKRVSLSNHRL